MALFIRMYECEHVNPFLHRLFLDHDIISYFETTLKKIKKNLSKVLNSFENIMENGAFALKEQMLHFPTLYFKGVKSKGLTNRIELRIAKTSIQFW